MSQKTRGIIAAGHEKTAAAGGGFLLAHTQNNQNILFDFFSQTPRQKRNLSEINFYPVEVSFVDAVQEFHIGMGSMAVPGNIAGVFHVHQKLGRLPFHVVAETAIHYAKNGLPLNRFQYYCLAEVLKPIITTDKGGQQVFSLTGEPLEPEATLRMT